MRSSFTFQRDHSPPAADFALLPPLTFSSFNIHPALPNFSVKNRTYRMSTAIVRP